MTALDSKPLHRRDATQHPVRRSPVIADHVAKTTCYMCACRCGIDVHVKDGRVAYIEGNRDHPVNKGVLCAKGAAGIMQVNAPARLRAPLKRVGPRGSGQFEQISWEEALETAVSWLKPIRETAPEKLAFFTGRDQSQSFTGLWAQSFGTPNYAAHGGFCSVNMAAAGIYTMGGAFWEFGQPDWDHTKLFMLFGCAEDHDSNPIKTGLAKLKARGAKVFGVNPVRTGYNAVADEWVGITPGTDGLFVLAMVHVWLRAGTIDLDYLARYTNAPCLVAHAPGTENDGLLLRDDDGKTLVKDRGTGELVPFDRPGVKPDLAATHEAEGVTYRTVMALIGERYTSDEYAPEAVAERCGLSAERIRAIAAQVARTAFEAPVVIEQPWTDFRGERHERMVGRPVTFHAMRGISAHSNGFQTCRAIHLAQILMGAVEVPGGFRFKPPYPKPATAHPKPHCKVTPGQPLDGPHLGYPQGPDDLALKEDGSPARIDKAFTWDAPMSAHGLMHMVISNAHAGDPYEIDTLFLFMANMAWNSSMNTGRVMEMLTDKGDDGEYRIPRIIYSDAYSSEMVAYADLVLPDATYLERHDCISLLDRPICEADGLADSIRWPVVEPDRDVRGFQSVLCDLGHRLGLPAFTNEDGTAKYADYADYMVNHERKPGIGPLAGFRGADGDKVGRGEPNPDQIERYKANGGFFVDHLLARRPLLQAVEHGLSALGGRTRPLRPAHTLPVRPLCRAAAALPPRRAGSWATPAAGPSAREARHDDGPAAHLVRALRGGRGGRWRLPAARHHPASRRHVPRLGLAERLAAPDPRRQPALRRRRRVARARLRARRLGARHLCAWPHHRAGRAHGGAEPAHRVDVERHRQAQGRLGLEAGRAGGREGLPAQPPHPRAPAAQGRRAALGELRPHHRPGRVVRPAREDREDRPAHRRAAGHGRDGEPRGLRALRDPHGPRRAGRAADPWSGGRADMTALPPPSPVKLGLVIDLVLREGVGA